MKILTAQQMRELDRLTVERCGISYATLMETAATRVVETIIEHYGSLVGTRFNVFCGKGNNGGDGAAIARGLWLRGATKVNVYLIGRLVETGSEARANLEAIRKIAVEEGWPEYPLSRVTFCEVTRAPAENNGTGDWSFEYSPGILVIDALLGTGLTRPAEGLYAAVIEAINGFRGCGRIISVDLPSGLSSDSGQAIGPHVRADLTVSFTCPKLANVLPPACYANGQLVVASIGTPSDILRYEVKTQLQLVGKEWPISYLFQTHRAPEAHKGSVGDVLLIAGSRGKTGAAALAAEAVLRAGAGLVTVATARSAQALLVTQTKNEVMTEALDEVESGAIAHTAVTRALELASNRTVLALGPGLSSSEESTRQFVEQFVEQRNAPLIIDADGLNALAPWPAGLSGSRELPLIITPHPGEMARLLGKTTAEVVADRIHIAREFATQHHVITVLKGNRTLIAAPDGEVYVNPTGNAGMATAGAGDVLTGLLAGLLAQHPQIALVATLAAVYLHGLAGDIAARKLGQRSLIASDLIAYLSKAILKLGGTRERDRASSVTSI